MDVRSTNQDSSSTNIFLTGAILLANMDYSSLGDYAIKAALGGAVWMAFKLTADYIGEKIKSKGK